MRVITAITATENRVYGVIFRCDELLRNYVTPSHREPVCANAVIDVDGVGLGCDGVMVCWRTHITHITAGGRGRGA